MSGLACVIGLERTFRFFFQWHKAKGSGAFFGGILIVLFGWPIIGMCVELYGFVVLFSGFFPVAINFLRRIPVIGTILSMPPIGTVIMIHTCSSYYKCSTFQYLDNMAGDQYKQMI